MSDSVSAGLPFALFGSGTGVGTFSREGLARPARSAEPASATVNRSISGTGPSNGASRARPSSLPSFAGLLASEPSYTAYLDIISLAAIDGDDNTAYFYLEELLKQGYDDYEALYSIPKTELLRIKPTYNELVESYLGKSKF